MARHEVNRATVRACLARESPRATKKIASAPGRRTSSSTKAAMRKLVISVNDGIRLGRRFRLFQHMLYAGVHDSSKRFRMKPNPEHEQQQRPEGDNFAEAQVPQMRMVGI